MNVAELIDEVHERFAAAPLFYGHGTDNAWDEAVALVLGVTGVADDRSALTAAVSAQDAEQIQTLAERRIDQRQPLGHLLGFADYCGLRFETHPGVLLPRSPIGPLLVSGALDPWLPAAPGRILDLCCGSGCLGLLAAAGFADTEVVLADVDPVACDLAERNVTAQGQGARVSVVQGDLFEALTGPPFDLVLCNPPYVNARDMHNLPQEYRHEPQRALAAGEDGLDLLKRILAGLPAWLCADGLFIGEAGFSAPALDSSFADLPFIWPDLPAGGEGVFLLEGAALNSHTASPTH